MKFLTRHGGLWLLLFFCWLPSASAQGITERVVAGIIVTNQGPVVASEELIRANIHVKKGDVYNRLSVDDDVRNLYKTGFFFNIQVGEQSTDGGVVLTYILQGKYRLTGINFTGNAKYSTAKLLKKVSSKIGDPLDERKLFNDTQEIQKLYEKAGYTKTTVTYALNNIDKASGRASVTFEVKETPRIKIVEVDFPGAQAFTQAKLRRLVKTRKHWMFSWITRHGYFKEDQFEEDKEALAELYQKAGYIDFEIKDIKITNPTPTTMKIEFVLYEGNRYKVGAVSIKGNHLFTTEQIIQGLKAQHEASRSKAKIGEHGLQADVGLIYTPQALADDIQAISDFYGSKGYIDVHPGPNLRVERIPNTDTGTMDLEYQIDEGEKSFIEKIDIRGNVKTKDKVIRRELIVSPGEVFDMVRVRLSKQRLEGMDFFDKVDVKPEPTDVPSHKNLIVGVDEKSTGNLTFGAGFNTVESISGLVEVSQSNFDLFNPPYFTGAGQKFRLRLQLGTLVQDYHATFIEPWFMGKHLSLSVDLYHTLFNYVSLDSLYNESRTGARIGLTRALGSEFLRGTAYYNVEDIGILNVSTNAPNTILADAGYTVEQRFGTSLTYDSRGPGQLPNKGQQTEFLTELSVGDRDFIKMELKTDWYFKGLAEGHVLQVVGKAGVAQKLSSQDVPFFDRYYLGGQYSLRGYDYRGVGPRQVTQDGIQFEPIGGDTYWFGSLEYSIPVGIPHVRVALFYDIGNVSAAPFSNAGFPVTGIVFGGPAGVPFLHKPIGTTLLGNTGAYSDNYGLGLHIDIPHLGPLRLDYGIPLHHDQFNGSNGKFQFGVGFTRPL